MASSCSNIFELVNRFHYALLVKCFNLRKFIFMRTYSFFYIPLFTFYSIHFRIYKSKKKQITKGFPAVFFSGWCLWHVHMWTGARISFYFVWKMYINSSLYFLLFFDNLSKKIFILFFWFNMNYLQTNAYKFSSLLQYIFMFAAIYSIYLFDVRLFINFFVLLLVCKQFISLFVEIYVFICIEIVIIFLCFNYSVHDLYCSFQVSLCCNLYLSVCLSVCLVICLPYILCVLEYWF